MAVILTANGRPAGPSNPIDVKIPLVVIRDAEHAGRRMFCRVCQMRGEESVFYEGEELAFSKHIKLCASRHESELRGRSLRVKAPALFDPEQSGDVERGKWIRQHRDEILAGRLTY
jgi:hypothetical protein